MCAEYADQYVYVSGFKVGIQKTGVPVDLMSNVGILVTAGSATTISLRHEIVSVNFIL